MRSKHLRHHERDDRAQGGCERPLERIEYEFEPQVFTTWQDRERAVGGDAERPSGLSRAVSDLYAFENEVVIAFGKRNEAKVAKLGKHAALLHGTFHVRAVEPPAEVIVLSGVPSDSQEVDDQVCRDLVHMMLQRFDAATLKRILAEGGGSE